MKALCATAAVVMSLTGLTSSTSAQPYGGPDYGYGDRGYRYRDRDYRDRDFGYRDRDYRYGERGPRYRGREFAFDEREYLRCNPDVRVAVMRGAMQSGFQHYQTYGVREGRRLTC